MFATVTANCFCALTATVAVLGETLTVTGRLTVTTALPDLVGSAAEDAFTITCAGFGTDAGAE